MADSPLTAGPTLSGTDCKRSAWGAYASERAESGPRANESTCVGGKSGGNLAPKNYLAFSPIIWHALERFWGGNLGGNLAFSPPLELVLLLTNLYYLNIMIEIIHYLSSSNDYICKILLIWRSLVIHMHKTNEWFIMMMLLVAKIID